MGTEGVGRGKEDLKPFFHSSILILTSFTSVDSLAVSLPQLKPRGSPGLCNPYLYGIQVSLPRPPDRSIDNGSVDRDAYLHQGERACGISAAECRVTKIAVAARIPGQYGLFSRPPVWVSFWCCFVCSHGAPPPPPPPAPPPPRPPPHGCRSGVFVCSPSPPSPPPSICVVLVQFRLFSPAPPPPPPNLYLCRSGVVLSVLTFACLK